MEDFSFYGLMFIAAVTLYKFFVSFRMVPNQTAQVVERFGRYHATLNAGFHTLLPFIDRVAYIHDLREKAIAVEPQECFTRDNVRIEVDGVIYLRVIDPYKATYAVTDYEFAAIQLAQTSIRSIIGTLEMDRTFEEREKINAAVLSAFDQIEQGWGINVTRYEVKNIVPPQTVRQAMEQQMAAERDRRALLARSEGIKQSKVNDSEGKKGEMINRSEGEMRRRINEAEGRAAEIEALADATASSIEKIAEAISASGGEEAIKMRLTQQYLLRLAELAKPGVKLVLPANVTDFDSLVAGLGLGRPLGETDKR